MINKPKAEKEEEGKTMSGTPIRDSEKNYLAILRKAIGIPEVQDNIKAKNRIQKQKAELLRKGEEIDHEIASLRKKESASIDASIEARMSQEVISRAAMERERIQALTKIQKEIERRTSEADQNLEIARGRIFQSASRVFKLVQIDEQERLDRDLADIADRVKSWNDALDRVGKEIEAYHAIFYMSENSSLNCKHLLKILRI